MQELQIVMPTARQTFNMNITLSMNLKEKQNLKDGRLLKLMLVSLFTEGTLISILWKSVLMYSLKF